MKRKVLFAIGIIAIGLPVTAYSLRMSSPAAPGSYVAVGKRLISRDGGLILFSTFTRTTDSDGSWRLENEYLDELGTVIKRSTTICQPDQGAFVVFPDRLEALGPCYQQKDSGSGLKTGQIVNLKGFQTIYSSRQESDRNTISTWVNPATGLTMKMVEKDPTGKVVAQNEVISLSFQRVSRELFDLPDLPVKFSWMEQQITQARGVGLNDRADALARDMETIRKAREK